MNMLTPMTGKIGLGSVVVGVAVAAIGGLVFSGLILPQVGTIGAYALLGGGGAFTLGGLILLAFACRAAKSSQKPTTHQTQPDQLLTGGSKPSSLAPDEEGRPAPKDPPPKQPTSPAPSPSDSSPKTIPAPSPSDSPPKTSPTPKTTPIPKELQDQPIGHGGNPTGAGAETRYEGGVGSDAGEDNEDLGF